MSGGWAGPRIKVGREYIDPNGRHVTALEILPGPMVRVRLGGSYGATVTYPASAMRDVMMTSAYACFMCGHDPCTCNY